MRGRMSLVLTLIWLLMPASAAFAAAGEWEFQVVILQGLSAGGSYEKRASGIFVDRKRTSLLNELAAEGWEVVSVVGAPGTDHSVYLRRRTRS